MAHVNSKIIYEVWQKDDKNNKNLQIYYESKTLAGRCLKAIEFSITPQSKYDCGIDEIRLITDKSRSGL